MCGIAGLLDRRSSPAEAQRILSRMSAEISRRGPDGDASWSDAEAGVHFAHRRLAIIDLSDAGRQPMASGDGKVVICYNGMLYNAPDLRAELVGKGWSFRGHSDTEVIANAFAHWGLAATLAKLNGMFAIAAWWRDERRLVLARDRLGKKPLYWARIDGGLVFASELPSVCCHPGVSRAINRGAAASYLRTGHVPDPHSIIEGVGKVPAGAFLSLGERDSEPALTQWWSLADIAAQTVRQREAGAPPATQAGIADLLDDAVRRRMVSDVPLGAFLSGGIDSSLIVARMQALSDTPVRTFSIGYKEAAYDESADAERIARHLGTQHETFLLSPMDVTDAIARMPEIYGEPFADPSSIPSTILAQRAREKVTVVLTGDGGDEVFAGYNRYVAARSILAKLDPLPRPLRSALGALLVSVRPSHWDRILTIIPESKRPRSVGEKLHRLGSLLPLAPAQRYRQVTSQWHDPSAIALDPEAAELPALQTGIEALADPVDQLRFLDLMSYLPGDILTKVDRATMACGLEARAPLLDYRLVEASFSIPTATHMAGGQAKAILRNLLARDVPRDMFERPKSGFGIPIESWLRHEMRDWAEDLLNEQGLRDSGLVNVAAVRNAWDRHLSGKSNEQYGLWTVLMLQSWRRWFAELPV